MYTFSKYDPVANNIATYLKKHPIGYLGIALIYALVCLAGIICALNVTRIGLIILLWLGVFCSAVFSVYSIIAFVYKKLS